MTSPSGNVVQIVVTAKNQTDPAFEEARRGANRLGDSLKRIGEIAGGVLVAGAVQSMAQKSIAFIKGTVKAATDLGESVNAVNQIFDSSAAEVVAWGEKNAAAFGLSQRAFNQMATPLGAMLKNQGLQLSEVSDHTIKLTERAADMASVFNTDVSEALVAIQAGLRGEQDPLERFGVSLSAAAVESRALADSGKANAKELTAQEKALARLNIIYDQTQDTAGDFKNTSDGLANSQRIATAQFEDAQAKIGTTFTPILAKAAVVAGNLAESFGNLPGPAQMVIAAVVGLGAAAALLAPKILAAKAALDQMAISDSRVQRGIATTTKVALKAGAAFGAISLGAAALGAAFGSDLNPQIEAATKGLEEFADGAISQSREMVRIFGTDLEDLQYAFGRLATDGFEEGADRLSEWLIPALSEMDTSMAKASERVQTLDLILAQMVKDGNGEKAAEIVQFLADETGQSLERAMEILPGYAAAMETGADKTIKLGKSAEEAAPSLDELEKQLDDLIDQSFSYEEAQDKAADAVARLREQVKENTEEHDKNAKSLEGNSQTARDNREQVRGLVRDYEDLMIKTQAEGKSIDGLQKELEDLLVGMGFNRTEAQKYTQKLQDVKKALDDLKNKEITLKLNIDSDLPGLTRGGGGQKYFASGGITGAASGGQRGGWTMVGERGRELVKLPFGSQVIPNGTTENMLSRSSGGGETRVVIDFSGAPEELKKWLRRIVRVEGGGNVQTAFGRS